MRIVQINMVANGSTGNIMRQIASCARKYGHEVVTYSSPSFSRSHPETFAQYDGHKYFGTPLNHAVHYIIGRITGRNGCLSYFATRKLVNEIKAFSPDIVHLHNIHNWCIHIPTLFRYLKKSKVRVFWTLHDCWTFTGHCPYFDMVRCEKWKTKCYECSQCNVYPESAIDNSRWGFLFKKKWFTSVENMTLVTPSAWLSNLVKESFMSKYSVSVIYNGINLALFHPTQSDFRKRMEIKEDQFMILGVAFEWGMRKGLDVFLELAERLDKRFVIVLVGTNESVDAKLPPNIISIHNTQNQKELIEIYSAADLFVNPTREDNFPTVNLESLASGTPVLTFRTGGSPEAIDETCGTVVEKNDINAMENEIMRIYAERPYKQDDCIKRAKEFDANEKFEEYVRMYCGE